MNRIAIIGAGAVGATVGAWLATSRRNDVVFCARTPFAQLRVETPEGLIELTPQLITDVAQAASVDWIIVATKAYDAGGAWLWIEALSSEGSRVAVLQNGVEHLARFPDLDTGLIVPAVVDIPAERHAPGQVVQRREGMMVVPSGKNGEDFAELFVETSIDVRTTDDWLTAAWRKLAINCAGAVNALALAPAGIVHDPEVADLMRSLVRECVAVGRAEGANLADTLPNEVVDGYRASPANSVNSIYADRLAGRSMEADARNGVIARLAAKHGLQAPLNEMANVILKTRSES